MTAGRHFQRISRSPFEQEAMKSPSGGAMRQTGNKTMSAHKMSGIASAKPLQGPTGRSRRRGPAAVTIWP
jgi:hypothetical protein